MAPKKLLAFHGVAQSGPVFHRRCQTIVDHLTPLGYSIHFLTAPHSISGTSYSVARQTDWQPGDDERSWWTTDDDSLSHPSISAFLETAAAAIHDHGPFAGALGFSQGGCAAASVCAMLEPSRRCSSQTRRWLSDEVLANQPPLQLLVLFSANPYRFPLAPANDVDVRWLFYPADFTGYPYDELSVPTRETLTLSSKAGERRAASTREMPEDAYPLKIKTPLDNRLCTPTLAFYGKAEWDADAFSRGRQQWFFSRCVDVRVHAHPWKHTVPRTEDFASIVRDFVESVDQKTRDVKAVL